MTNWPALRNAPIIEGMIDIRIERSATVGLEDLKMAADELAGDYPSRKERRTWTGQISLPGKAAPSLTTQRDEVDGILLVSSDRKWVVQYRLDGFTISRLKPYTTWSELKNRAFELWPRYSAVARPQRIVRIATRFINRIPLTPGEPLESTFATNLVLAPGLPQQVAGFLLRVLVPYEQENAFALLTQTSEENGVNSVFDIDAFMAPGAGINAEEIWSLLETLRTVKNRSFFESLTSKALEQFR